MKNQLSRIPVPIMFVYDQVIEKKVRVFSHRTINYYWCKEFTTLVGCPQIVFLSKRW